jgi:glucose/arabinose dehydrogenase/N-acetylneuraminic acid mutarotase
VTRSSAIPKPGRTIRAAALAIAAFALLALAMPANGPAAGYEIQVSTSADRSSPLALQGFVASEQIYVFTNTTAQGVSRVRFWLDNPSMSGTPYRTETGAPHDLQGTESNGNAKPLSTASLPNGSHSVTAAIDLATGGTEVVTATFTVANLYDLRVSQSSSRTNSIPLDGATVSRNMYAYSTPSTGVSRVDFFMDDPNMTGQPLFVETKAPFDLLGTNSDGTAKALNTKTLANGNHTVTARMTRTNGGTEVVSAAFTVDNHTQCLLDCSLIRVELPFDLNFNEDRGRLADNDGVGTGFPYIDPPDEGTGYRPELLDVNPVEGHLDVTTTDGIAFAALNTQQNALGAGFQAPNQVTRIETTIESPPPGTGNFEQAGLYFGNDQDNFIKVVVMSSPEGLRLQSAMELKAKQGSATTTQALDLTNSSVALTIVANPFDRTVKTSYRVNGGTSKALGSYVAPGEFFSFDAAGIDPRIGTRSFAGIFASHRRGPAPLTYRFNDFSIRKDTGSAPPPISDVTFDDATRLPVSNPTSMAFGPDGRLYVTEMFGRIHAMTLNAARQVVSDQLITTLGSRLTLGLTVDPASTPSNVILWVSHSSPSLDNGVPNSGTVTRLSGASFTTRQDVVTGLPRALANHGTNSIHFGPDGKLYIAQGGNTGAGAPNNANTEFGTMQEQPLSAAMLVADVNGTGFDGSCNNTSNIFGPPPCDVIAYATGLRNTYDFVWHSTGFIFGPNNGLGVAGTFPPSTTPPCFGFGDTASWTQGGDDPGEQPDDLNKILPGRYYGHPNPYRNECVFGDGHFQNASPLPNFEAPFFRLGDHRSANGTIEYTGDAFCGELENEILIANYSVGDNITRVKLSADGSSVVSAGSLFGGLNDPLPLAQDASGNIFVGEFGGNRVRVLKPIDLGCWTSRTPAPVSVLDAGGTSLNEKLYVIAGKTSAGHRSTVNVFDDASGSWSTAASLPGPAVENPAVVAHNGRLYAFGGSTEPFAGAVTNAAVYNPATNQWTPLAPMSTGRAGATAQVIGGKIYVAGGMAANGASLASVEVLDVASGTWSAGPSMATRRDNPGGAALDGKLYVFGGRTRNTDGTVTNGTLATVEMLDPATGTWVSRATMPTGRRTMVTATLNGRAQLIGGEVTASNGAFQVNEEYDPVTDTWRRLRSMPSARHGAVAGVIDGRIHVVGGGPDGGLTFTNAHEVFAFQG